MNKRQRKKHIARVFAMRRYLAFKAWCDLGFVCMCDHCRTAHRYDALYRRGHKEVRTDRARARRGERNYFFSIPPMDGATWSFLKTMEETHSKTLGTTAGIDVEYWQTDVKRDKH